MDIFYNQFYQKGEEKEKLRLNRDEFVERITGKPVWILNSVKIRTKAMKIFFKEKELAIKDGRY